MKPEKWYQRRLAKYFTENYEQYDEVAEYFNDPEINQWLFDIPELGVRIELTCDDNGMVTEQRYKKPEYANVIRGALRVETYGLDAVYEDYIIRLVGQDGFDILREKKYLTTCGSVNGRTLYTLN